MSDDEDDAHEDDAHEDVADDATAADDATTAEEAGDGSRPESPGPLGDLRDRVVDEPDRSPAAYPDESADAAAEVDASGADADARGADEDDRPALKAADESRSGPLGDLAAGVDERRQRKTDADDELFDEVEVDEVDSEALWEQVRTDEPDVGPRGDRQVREIDKHKYCQRCPHFSTPPDVGCTHEGTDILEQLDMETFKVADCPIILEDERLEDATTAESESTD